LRRETPFITVHSMISASCTKGSAKGTQLHAAGEAAGKKSEV